MNDKEAKQEIKDQYRQQTGKELPDHVIENLGKLTGHSLHDYQRLENRVEDLKMQQYDEDNTSAVEVVGAVLIVAITGLGAMYLTQYIPSWPGKIVGGVLLWVLTFGLIDIVLTAINEVMGDE